MLERDEGYGPKTQKILPLHFRANFSWMDWISYLRIYAMTVPLGSEVLEMNTALLVETAAQKTARVARCAAANATMIFVISQAAMGCDEARAIVTAHQMSINKGNVFALFTLLEERFTQKKLQTLAKLLLELNQLVCLPGVIPAKLLDRFNKIVLSITSIDVSQLPTELQLTTILKNAISDKFKMLNVMLQATQNLTLALLKEKFIAWETKFEIALDGG